MYDKSTLSATLIEGLAYDPRYEAFHRRVDPRVTRRATGVVDLVRAFTHDADLLHLARGRILDDNGPARVTNARVIFPGLAASTELRVAHKALARCGDALAIDHGDVDMPKPW